MADTKVIPEGLARPDGTGSRAAHEAPAGLRPAGFDPSRMAFNVNERVWVKLTARGREILREREERLAANYPGVNFGSLYREDAQGWSEWQLWSLMHELGEHMFNGARVPFETTLLIDAQALRGAIPRDSDGSPEGEDAQAAEFTTARAEGIAQGEVA